MPRKTLSRPAGRARRAVAAGAAVAALAALAAAGPATSAFGAVKSAVPAAAVPAATRTVLVDGPDVQRFLALYDKIHDPANGYFSPQGIPYHSRETLMVEAPDYGHETTSEAYSFWLWLETSYGQVTGDWAPFNHAWDTIEKYMIPTHENQPTNSAYDPSKPATYAPEANLPSSYPAQLNSGVSVGKDPLANELKSTYGTSDVYGMHWIEDTDNVYGFGAAPGQSKELGPTYKGPSYINTFQRGPQESVWETIPQPSIDDFTYGGKNGFLDLFTGDSSYAKQWKYTDAPDADARAIEATYWATQFAAEQGQASAVASSAAKASKMGDYLRYAMFDKYFKDPGCASTSCTAGSGKDSAHYLLSWYYAWGGALDTSAPWAWRIGSSHAHFGYQNPMAAWALANDPTLEPKSPTAPADWSTSLERQLEFYQWLQSPDGGIAGGATNSIDGQYAARPAGAATFYGMAYQEAPVYNDPPSNNWMGMQGWGVERVAQLYEETGNPRAKTILDKWVPWVLKNITVGNGTWQIPSNLAWSGQPDSWNATSPGANANLKVTVTSYGQDVGVAGALARTLMYYAAGAKTGAVADQAKQTAHDLLDAIWTEDSDQYGVSTTETRDDFSRFDDTLTSNTGDGIYVPAGWTGKMPNGDVIKPGVSFLDIRSFYKNDPDWAKVQTQLNGGAKATFNYHRFWAQTAIATALADYDRLFGETGTPGGDTTAPTAPTGVKAGTATTTSIPVSWTASTDDTGVTGYNVLVDGVSAGTPTATSFTVTGLSAGTTHTITVTAHDAAGNVSAASAPITATTAPATGDPTPPSVPTGLKAGTVTDTTAVVSWTASTDNVGVTGYNVLVDGVLAGTSTTTSFTITGLAAASTHQVSVTARDAAGNFSAASTAITVTTAPAPGDTVKPSQPTGLKAGTVTTTSIPVSWTASTDNVGVTGYNVLVNGTLVGTSTTTSFTITGLNPGSAYQITVTARDAAGNVSDASTALAASTSPGTVTGTCTADYKVINSWPGGYQGEITVKAGSSAITTWSVTAPAGLSTTNFWGGKLAGGVFTPETWNANLSAGGTATVGFIGSGTAPAAGSLACK